MAWTSIGPQAVVHADADAAGEATSMPSLPTATEGTAEGVQEEASGALISQESIVVDAEVSSTT